MTTAPTTLAPATRAGRATTRQNLVTIALAWWLIAGVFTDGWAHNQFGETLETFFTPWHAAFYSGFLAVAGWCLFLASRGWREGRRGLRAFPDGYHLAELGWTDIVQIDSGRVSARYGMIRPGIVSKRPTRLHTSNSGVTIATTGKKLTAKARERLEAEIKAAAVAWAVAFASVEEIETLNIHWATGLAMKRAIEALIPAPAFVLIDGNSTFRLEFECRTIVGGDAKCLTIAAASILAKTARDRVMVEMDALHPGYGFAAHKGYNAPIHQEALKRLGPSPIHRQAWAPVRAVITPPLLLG